jgi:hypothetical protein
LSSAAVESVFIFKARLWFVFGGYDFPLNSGSFSSYGGGNKDLEDYFLIKISF